MSRHNGEWLDPISSFSDRSVAIFPISSFSDRRVARSWQFKVQNIGFYSDRPCLYFLVLSNKYGIPKHGRDSSCINLDEVSDIRGNLALSTKSF